MLEYFADDLAVDLGTANTLIYVKGQGIILDEPSVIAIHRSQVFGGRQKGLDDSVLAVGSEAKQMLGKTPANIRAIRPMKDGVIADFAVTEIMLKHFISKAQSRRLFLRPRIVISVPCQSTPVERRAIEEWAGTEKIAGDLFDQQISYYVQQHHGILIGEPTAEQIKQLIGTAWSGSKVMEMEIRGRNFQGSAARKVITSTEIYQVLTDPLDKIIQGVKKALNNSPPELSSDIWERGILLAGGGALLRDIDRRFTEDLGIPTIIAEDPLTCVARGCGRALEQSHLLNKIQTSS